MPSELSPRRFPGRAVATTLEGHRASRRFLFGFHRVASLAFFASAAALLSLGGFLLYEAVATLLAHDHPSIGAVRLPGQEAWLVWPMVAALAYSCVPPVILGRLKKQPAAVLRGKVLATDAEMNAADWKTGVAGILGIVDIAWGLWWADAAAAGLISLSIVKDGAGVLRTAMAMAELVDGAPQALRSARLWEDDEEPQRRARAMGARLRLRETGRLLTGVLRSRDPADLERLTEGLLASWAWRVRDLSWRPLGDGEGLNGEG